MALSIVKERMAGPAPAFDYYWIDAVIDQANREYTRQLRRHAQQVFGERWVKEFDKEKNHGKRIGQ